MKIISSILVVVTLALGSDVYGVTLKQIEKTKLYELRTANFHIITDANEKLGRALITDLENFRYFLAFVEGRQILEGVPPLKILAIHKKQMFKKLDLPDSWAGVFSKQLDGSFSISNINDYSKKSTSLSVGKHVLMHEYVHYAMSNMFDQPPLPYWYNEGIAEYYGTFSYRDDQISLGQLKILKWRLFDLKNPSGTISKVGVEELFKSTGYPVDIRKKKNSYKEKRNIQKFYARSVAVFHYMNASRERKQAFSNFIADVSNGESVDKAFKKSFDTTYEKMDKDIYDYLNGNKLYGWNFNTGKNKFRFPDLDISVKELGLRQKTYEVLDILVRFYSFGEKGGTLLKESRERFPDHNGLKILAAQYQHNLDDLGKALLVEVLKQEPDNAYVLSLLGESIFRKAKLYRDAGLDGANKKFDHARSYFRKSVAKNPFSGRSNIRIGDIYTHKVTEKLIKEGIAAFDNARFLVNWNDIPNLNYDDAWLKIRSHNNDGAAASLKKYIAMSDSSWAKGFGTFLLEALELKALAHQSPKEQKPDGSWVLSDGSVYRGDVVDNKFHGVGKLERSDGVIVEAQWDQGVLSGEGEFKTTNGFVYRGRFSNGEITGAGVLIYPENHYIRESRGEFVNGLEHGNHTFVFANGASEKTDYWWGAPHGKAHTVNKDGIESERHYVFGARKFMLDDNRVFVGSTDTEGKPKGQGICYSLDAKTPERCHASNLAL